MNTILSEKERLITSLVEPGVMASENDQPGSSLIRNTASQRTMDIVSGVMSMPDIDLDSVDRHINRLVQE